MKFNITMKGGVATLYLEGDIGDWGWTPKLWSEKVAELTEKGCTLLEVRINSRGGSVVDALAICDCIGALKKSMRVEAVVCGMAASAATLIACVCDRVRITPQSTWMVHEPSCTLSGDMAELRAQMKAFEAARARVYEIYATATGKTVAELEAAHAAAVYYTAAEAVAYGFCELDGEAAEKTDENPEEAGADSDDDAGDETEPTEARDEEEGAPGGEEEPEEEATMFHRFCAWLRGERKGGVQAGSAPAVSSGGEREIAALRAELAGARASLEHAVRAADRSEAEFTERVNRAVAETVARGAQPVGQLPAASDSLPRESVRATWEKNGWRGAFARLQRNI